VQGYSGRCLWRKDTSPNPSRNVGGFRNSPHTPLKRPDQGGLRAPLFWTSSPGSLNPAALSEAESADGRSRDQTPTSPNFLRSSDCGGRTVRPALSGAPGRGLMDSVGTSNQPLPYLSKKGAYAPFCGTKAVSFGPCTARFLCRKQRKWGVHSLHRNGAILRAMPWRKKTGRWDCANSAPPAPCNMAITMFPDTAPLRPAALQHSPAEPPSPCCRR